MWAGEKGAHDFLVNVIWPLTPFAADNGATHIYPHSPGAEGMAKPDPGEPLVSACEPGAATCFLGTPTHGAGPHTTNQVLPRAALGYLTDWLKPYHPLGHA